MPLDGSTAALARLDACLGGNNRVAVETNLFVSYSNRTGRRAPRVRWWGVLFLPMNSRRSVSLDFSRTPRSADRAPCRTVAMGWSYRVTLMAAARSIRHEGRLQQVLRPYQQNGKTVAIRQFKGRTPPPSTRFRAFLADGAATTGALASGFG